MSPGRCCSPVCKTAHERCGSKSWLSVRITCGSAGRCCLTCNDIEKIVARSLVVPLLLYKLSKIAVWILILRIKFVGRFSNCHSSVENLAHIQLTRWHDSTAYVSLLLSIGKDTWWSCVSVQQSDDPFYLILWSFYLLMISWFALCPFNLMLQPRVLSQPFTNYTKWLYQKSILVASSDGYGCCTPCKLMSHHRSITVRPSLHYVCANWYAVVSSGCSSQ